MKIKLALAAIIVLSVSGCAYLEKAQQSKEFKAFCDWAPVAVVGINEAATEAEKDPANIKVANAMREAVGYLSLVAGQCPKPGTPT